jgi:hypothetical protein
MAYQYKGPNVEERVKRANFDSGNRRSYRVIGLNSPDAFDPEREEAKRHGIGGNNAPRFDPDMPVTGFPRVMRDIDSFRLQDGTEITSRSAKRRYEKENGVEFTGVEYTADSDLGKPEWWDEYKDHRKDRNKALKKGKADPGTFHERLKREKRSMKTKVKFKDGKEQY